MKDEAPFDKQELITTTESHTRAPPLKLREISEPFDLSPEQFEKEVEHLLRRVGGGLPELRVNRLEKIEGSDGVYEIDITARFEVLGSSFLVLIECKRHRHPIKREIVQILHDRIRAVGANKGMIFSTSGFQKGAIEFARAHSITLIRIVDGNSAKGILTLSCASTRTLELILGGPLDSTVR